MPPSAHDTFRSLTLAEAPPADVDISEPFPVLYAGPFKQGVREIPVTEADLDQAVRNFDAMKARGYEPPIDLEHRHALGQDAPAVGWYKELIRRGNQLLARVKWTDEAKEQIRKGQRRYFSPEFTPRGQDETGKELGFTLLSGALVTRPHLKGLGPVALSEGARDQLRDDVAEMRDALDDVAALVAERPPQMAKPDDTPPAAIALAEGAEIKIGDETFKVTAEHVKLLIEGPPKPESDETVVALRENVASLSERVQTAETALFTEQFTAFMAQARREGRVTASEETTTKWRERAEKLGLEETKSLMADIPAETIAMSERGHGDDAARDKTSEAPEGVNPDAHRAHERAVALAAERNIPYEEAAPIAFTEVYG